MKILLATGDNHDKLEAAELLEKNGELNEAAKYFEEANELVRARNLQRRGAHLWEYLQLSLKVKADPKELDSLLYDDWLIEPERISDAANAAYQLGAFKLAANLYKDALARVGRIGCAFEGF